MTRSNLAGLPSLSLNFSMALPPKKIQTLTEFHALGRDILKDTKSGRAGDGTRRYRQGVIQAYCKAHNVSSNQAYAARRLAEAYPARSAGWRELCQLRTPSGQQLHKTHVCLLLEVRDVKRRHKLARDCARCGWSTKQLIRHIRIVQGASQRPGARAPRVTQATDALALVEEITSRWLKWSEGLFQRNKDRRPQDLKRVRLDDLPREIRDLLDKARKPMERLKAEIGRTLRGDDR